ncbi:hypothetical protein TNCT_21481 [Trichonephila clavata]|uniref:Uncharacterized protein n=1 Tax=Trichonephila clavata TaxID=2740835 RepID=A0A8X6H3B1_TRICU|nr:hypothetical protein TNCT_21481 [Trichonephila clavata]
MEPSKCFLLSENCIQRNQREGIHSMAPQTTGNIGFPRRSQICFRISICRTFPDILQVQRYQSVWRLRLRRREGEGSSEAGKEIQVPNLSRCPVLPSEKSGSFQACQKTLLAFQASHLDSL